MDYLISLPRRNQKSFFHRFFTALKKVRLSLHWYRLQAMSLLKQMDALADEIRRKWLIFLDLANRVQASGVWRIYAANWHEFCRKRWNIDSSRISQLRTSKPYAIILKTLGAEPLEGEIKKFKPLLASTNPMLTKVYQLGQAVAKSEHRATTPAIYKRSLEVLETAQETGGVYQVGEKLFFIEDESQAIDAVKATLKEASKIGMEGESIPIAVKAHRVGDLWQLEADSELPNDFKFIFYMRVES